MNLFSDLEKFSSNTCVVDQNYKKFSYLDLLKLSDFSTSKIKKGSVVFLLCENSFEFLAIYVGLIRKKIATFLLGSNINDDYLNNLIKLYQPQFIIKPITIKFENSFEEEKIISQKYHILKTEFDFYSIKRDLALLLSTSGSTGSPRFVKISYVNIFDNTKRISDFLKISSKDTAITTLQPNYVYGLSIINSHLIKGAKLVMCKYSLVEKKFWELLKKTKVTNFGGVPYTYDLLDKLKFEKMNLPNLKYITQAGGKLSLNLLEKFISICKKKRLKMIIMYGQTEASGRISFLDWKFIEKKRGSIGNPIKGGKFFLYNNKKKMIDNNIKSGELVYEGKNVMLGYATNRKDLNKDHSEKKLFTGDIARKDDDGFYFIEGRNTRFIKITGHRFNLEELQNELEKNKIFCVCTGSEDNLKIFLKKKFSHKKLSEFILKRFNIKKINYLIYENVAIPRNENGKILYNKLNNI